MSLHISEQAGQLWHKDEGQAVHQQKLAARQKESAHHIPCRPLAAAERPAQHLHPAGLSPDWQGMQTAMQPDTPERVCPWCGFRRRMLDTNTMPIL
jgi:hypothetical protein